MKLFKKIENYKKQDNYNFVISDVKFIHEAKYIKDKGGILIKIIRDVEKDYNHISEKETNLIDKT